jgi:hypothetical protein
MLFADKNALRTQLKFDMLRIRERELQYYTNNCLAISTSAALLAGFAWYGLTEVPFDSNANPFTQCLYLVVTTLIMGLELLTVVNATLCAILGPGLALRGPDGSMHNAVQGMMTHYRFTLACFTLGLICFMISALLYSWMQFDWTLSLPMTLLVIYFLILLYRYYWRIYRRFRLPPDAAVTGAFNVGSGDGASSSSGYDAAQRAQQEAQEREYQREMEEMRKTYGHLPESVRASMGIGGASGNGGAAGASGNGGAR